MNDKYKLVPVEPTEKMLNAGLDLGNVEVSEVVWIYEAMLAAAPAVQVEPVGWHTEQQPGVTLLLELLSHARCSTCDGSGGFYDNHGDPHQCQWCHDRSTALAAYRKQGGGA